MMGMTPKQYCTGGDDDDVDADACGCGCGRLCV